MWVSVCMLSWGLLTSRSVGVYGNWVGREGFFFN